MKANELLDLIYVYFNCFDGSKIIAKVTGFKDGVVYGISDDGTHWCSIKKVEPIPLTPEILEKNGFKKDEKLEEMYYWNWGIGNNCVSYDKETGIVRIFHVFGYLVFVLPLSYVHELQHALRLCCIEKEIEL